jgi:hypothetical protein
MRRATSLLFLTAWAIGNSAAAHPPSELILVRGLPGVQVAVEDVSADEKGLGLFRDVLRKQVESVLTAGGVPLLDSVQRQRTPGTPYLYVHVGAVAVGDTAVAHTTIALRQRVRLEANPDQSIRASVWERTSQVAFTPGDLAPVRAQLRDLLSYFVDLYREANAPDPAPEAGR